MIRLRLALRLCPLSNALMIGLSKQNGHQILFIDASMGIKKGRRRSVEPNGAGKTTFFRMTSGRE